MCLFHFYIILCDFNLLGVFSAECRNSQSPLSPVVITLHVGLVVSGPVLNFACHYLNKPTFVTYIIILFNLETNMNLMSVFNKTFAIPTLCNFFLIVEITCLVCNILQLREVSNFIIVIDLHCLITIPYSRYTFFTFTALGRHPYPVFSSVLMYNLFNTDFIINILITTRQSHI